MDQEIDFANKPVLTLWDTDCLAASSDVTPDQVFGRVTNTLERLQLHSSLRMVAAVGVEEHSRITAPVAAAIRKSPIELEVLNDTDKDAADIYMKTVVTNFIVDNVNDSDVVILISHDKGFYEMFSLAKLFNFRTFLWARKGDEAKHLKRLITVDHALCWIDITRSSEAPANVKLSVNVKLVEDPITDVNL